MSTFRVVKIIGVNLIVLLTLLFLIEGFASYLLLVRKAVREGPAAERVHTRYDEELGWVNLPNVHVEDMYGTGVSLTTNSQRYRNLRDFGRKVSNNKVRIICSGDSFTLGYGVDDEHTWCHLLTILDGRLETINLGQGGYGVDQAYLWYNRNKNKLEHDIHIFAFITDDFKRIKHDTFWGYGKPYLIEQDGKLLQLNYPVPKFSYRAPWVVTFARESRNLKSIYLLRKSYKKVVSRKEASHISKDKKTQSIVSKIFAELKRANQEKGSLLVLVYLPTIRDYMWPRFSRSWRGYLRDEANKKDYYFIDIVEELRKVHPLRVKGFFNPVHLHFSEEGNEYIANVLLKKLSENPEIERKLESLPQRAPDAR